MLPAVDRDQLRMRNAREPFPGFGGAQVVVQLGHEDDDAVVGRPPGGDLLGRRAVQRRREQDDALDVVVGAVLQREFRSERPADEPGARQSTVAHEVHGGGDVELLRSSTVECALA
ncbi:unnamed protein product, partial [Penicillium discolor]